MTYPPEHIRHDDPVVEALLIVCWHASDLGTDAAHRLVGDILGRHDASVYEQFDCIAGLLDEYAACERDPAAYLYDHDLKLPRGAAMVDWQAATLDILAADAAITAGRLAAKSDRAVAS